MLWDFEKIHSKGWKLEKNHPGIQFSCGVLRWEFSIEYYSAHHVPPKSKTTESLT